ncbi:UDP-glucoronosyl and UDP-glucosyl transferase domain-containing protein [Ditylenchus destructor]|uniref:glucuronosyltransferase n=1 Tax=Ditylenchus destructor TaxID=166010 RepID=A0AAD4N872_9BILA|nr:UDP-glucoronosyl and UDP-glucosyl transferase domain-containing protein [Ditylenchus destructor]
MNLLWIKRRCYFTICATLFICVAEADKKRLKILVNSPTVGWSHMQFQSRIADALVEAGHEVHLLVYHMNPLVECCDKLKSRAQKIIHMERHESAKDAMMKLNVLKDSFSGKTNMIVEGSMTQWSYMLRDTCKDMLSNKNILDELKAERYDVAISEFYEVCIFGIFRQVGIKTKLASMAITLENWAGSPFGIYGVSSYVTNYLKISLFKNQIF